MMVMASKAASKAASFLASFCARTYLKRWVLFSITNFKIAITMAITALETLVLRGDQSLFEIVTQEFNKKLGKVE